MSDEGLHFPGQDLPEHKPEVPEAPAPEAPKPTEDKAPETPEAPAQPEAPQPEPPKEPEAPLPKKRSIYDDLKEARQDKNDWKDTTIGAIKALGVELKGDETLQQLQAILTERQQTPPAPVTPPAPAPQDPPADPLEAFAKEKGYDTDDLSRLAQIIRDQIPQSQLSEEEKKDLAELRGWKADQEAKDKRTGEDAAIQAEALSVQKQLSIADTGELTTVMAEIVRLAHTPKYADKEVDYIVFKEKDALSKLVSPKKPSFESGDTVPTPEDEPEVDFSKGGVTPEVAQKAVQSRTRTQLEHRKAQ